MSNSVSDLESAVDKAVLDKSVQWLDENQAAVLAGKISFERFAKERTRLELLFDKALREICIRIAQDKVKADLAEQIAIIDRAESAA